MKIKCRCSETRKTSYYHSSVGKSQNPCFNKKHTPNFLENEHFLPHVGMKCSFFRKFGALCFIEIPVLRFALLPYYGPSIYGFSR